MTNAEVRKIAKEVVRMLLPEIKSMVTTDEKPLVGNEEAAKFLGVSTSWVNHRIDEIPHYRLGGRNVFRQSQLREWSFK